MQAENKSSDKTMRIDIDPATSERLAAMSPRPAPRSGGRTWRTYHVERCTPFYKLLESVYDAVLITSRAGKVLECNERAAEFFAMSAKELAGLDVVSLISGATDSLIDTINKNLINKKYTLVEARCKRADGTSFAAEIAVNKVDLDPQGQLCFFVRDITIRQQAQQALEDAVERLQAHDRARMEFVSNVSHELRTPLTSMIYAVKPGKDVYVEKPLTATLAEGRRMVEAQQATGRVVAVGLNRRGNPSYRKLAEVLHGGGLGNLCVANAARISDLYPDGIGKQQPAEPPADFDWDLWLGPRAFRPYRYNIAPYKFRWYNDFSSQVGNWGVHYIDAIRWMMQETAPCAVSAHGSKLLDHDADIMDTMAVTFEFASGRLLTFQMFESCGGPIFPYGEIEIRGNKGVVYADERGYKIMPASAGQFQTWKRLVEPQEYTVAEKALPDGSSSVSTGGLIRDFLDCVKSRKAPLCPLEDRKSVV